MDKKITVTESKLRDIIKESLTKILEGINVSLDRRVTMTDEHELLVDTSLNNNPTYSDQILNGIRVWSIFKRKEGLPDEGDGNPMLYALKHENNYTLTNPKVVSRRIEDISQKLLSITQGIDVTIMLPSSNQLNKYFAGVIAKKCKNPKYIPDVLVKLSIEEVDNYIFNKDSLFRKHYGKKFEQAYAIFKNYCRGMEKGFQFHMIYDIDMRKVIEHTISLNNKLYSKYIKAINDKNIILVDDSITLGQSLKEATSIIKDNFAPKSILVVTLFSPLYDSSGTVLLNK